MNPFLAEIFITAHRLVKPRTPVPEITVNYFPFAGLNHTARLHSGRLRVRVSDIFKDAPQDVVQSLALILLAKLYRRKVGPEHHRAYRTFILTDEIQERARAARRIRARAARTRSPRGSYFDLEELFDRLNTEYFNGSIAKPRLSWSVKKARWILGRYDSTHQAIFISRVFDSPSVPTYVVEYVMYHEMLHVKHQSKVLQSRIVVHTPEFRNDEHQFRHYRQAKSWLKQI